MHIRVSDITTEYLNLDFARNDGSALSAIGVLQLIQKIALRSSPFQSSEANEAKHRYPLSLRVANLGWWLDIETRSVTTLAFARMMTVGQSPQQLGEMNCTKEQGYSVFSVLVRQFGTNPHKGHDVLSGEIQPSIPNNIALQTSLLLLTDPSLVGSFQEVPLFLD